MDIAPSLAWTTLVVVTVVIAVRMFRRAAAAPACVCPDCQTKNSAKDWRCESCGGSDFTAYIARASGLLFWKCDRCDATYSNFDCTGCGARLYDGYARALTR